MKSVFGHSEAVASGPDDIIDTSHLVDDEADEANSYADDGGDIRYLKPQGDRLVTVLDDVPGEVKKGKIIVIAEQKRPQFGTVVMAGADVKSGDLGTGARVCFGRYSGIEVELDGVTYNIIRETDVLATVENSE
jgi:chaperonin GroES